VLVVQQKRWRTRLTVRARVLNAIFCSGSVCRADRNQWRSARTPSNAP
jgi:hypothetical protein